MEDSIVLAGGCFWCLEAVFIRVRGVLDAESGYAGGSLPDPTYEQVCTGRTGHAEAVKVTFDPSVISLHDILTLFFLLHDPTTLNRQGNDVGTQYRSAVYYANEAQKDAAAEVMREIRDEKAWDGKLVTQLEPLQAFYPAGEYHRRYFEKHPDQAYCQYVIQPKVAKLRKKFESFLREDGRVLA
jgi:peptide-methionine (S)-S-oxide reductase